MAAKKSARTKASVSKKKAATGGARSRPTGVKSSAGTEHPMREHLLAVLEEIEELGEDLLQQIGKRLTELRKKAMGRVAATKKKVAAKKKRSTSAKKKVASKKTSTKKAAAKSKRSTAKKKTAAGRAVAKTRSGAKKSSMAKKKSTRRSKAKKARSSGASSGA